MTENKSYIVCGCKSWNRRSFDEIISRYLGQWHYVGNKEQLTLPFLEKTNPRFIFFLHWSWIVPDEMLERFECVNFHLTDLPYGRGGSPLQNLILAGHRERTKLTAIRMVHELDAGPVYLKEDLSLAGNAGEILTRQSDLAAHMIRRIIDEALQPTPQTGNIVVFKRRTPEQSRIPPNLTTIQLYDFIRMLDGEGYPPTFIESGGLRYTFRDATLAGDHLEGRVTVSPSAETPEKSLQ